MIYILILIYILICTYVFDYKCIDKQGRWRKVAWWSLCIIFILLAGLRYRIGIDTVVYAHNYLEFPTISQLGEYDFFTLQGERDARYEIGFPILASFTRSISSDFIYFQFLEAILINLAVFQTVRRETPHAFLCIGLYYIFLYSELNFEVMRQGITISLFLFAWPAFKKGKWWQYYLILLPVPFIHQTSIFLWFLPLLQLPKIREIFRFGWRTICVGCLLTGLLLVFKYYSGDIVIWGVENSIFPQRVERLYTLLPEAFRTVYNWKGILGIMLRMVVPTVGALLYFHFKRDVAKGISDKGSEEATTAYPLEMMGIIVIYNAVFSIVMWGFYRFNYYFLIFALILVSKVTFEQWPMIKIGKRGIRMRKSWWNAILLVMIIFQIYTYQVPMTKDGKYRRYQMYYPYNHVISPRHYLETDSIYYYRKVKM